MLLSEDQELLPPTRGLTRRRIRGKSYHVAFHSSSLIFGNGETRKGSLNSRAGKYVHEHPAGTPHPIMRLTVHKTALRAWCCLCQPALAKPGVHRHAFVGCNVIDPTTTAYSMTEYTPLLLDVAITKDASSPVRLHPLFPSVSQQEPNP